jgi:hypothetical protein
MDDTGNATEDVETAYELWRRGVIAPTVTETLSETAFDDWSKDVSRGLGPARPHSCQDQRSAEPSTTPPPRALSGQRELIWERHGPRARLGRMGGRGSGLMSPQ